mmetsp:Transcript_8388/g.37805  ORF Transcript_8388/g.37805 Transcript_8388/m.37805 type:complete len:219 (+) Transcript_8388:1378-2034(+)
MMTIEDFLFARGIVYELRRDERPEFPVLNLPRRRLLLRRLGLSLRRRKFLQQILDVLAAAPRFGSSRVSLIDASPRPFRSASTRVTECHIGTWRGGGRNPESTAHDDRRTFPRPETLTTLPLRRAGKPAKRSQRRELPFLVPRECPIVHHDPTSRCQGYRDERHSLWVPQHVRRLPGSRVPHPARPVIGCADNSLAVGGARERVNGARVTLQHSTRAG